MKPRCGKCRFSDVDVFSDSDDRGLCRRFPPVCEVHFKDDWCGEFQTKPVKKTKRRRQPRHVPAMPRL